MAALGWILNLGFAGSGVEDVTAPVLTSPTATATGATTASGTVDTDEGNGTLYWVVTLSATGPSAVQVQSGQDDAGDPAAASGSQAVSATGEQSVSVTGLIAGVAYYIHYQQQDAAANDSDVVSSAEFTTVSTDQPSGGWWYAYDHEYRRRERERKALQEAEDRTEQIQDDIERAIAKELRKQEAEAYRLKELQRLSTLAEQHSKELQEIASESAKIAAERAIRQGNYSAMEALERELYRMREEEEFLLQAVQMVIHA